MLERNSRITTDLRYGIEWHVTDEINGMGIRVGPEKYEPEKIPPGEYYTISNMIGEFDMVICDPTNIRKPIVIK